VVVAAVVLYQKCQVANKPYGLACAKAAFGEQVLVVAVAAIITKVFQIPCIGLAHYVCVQAVANTMFAVEQRLKNGRGMTYFLSQEQELQAKV
jgi:hypothetical protein